MSHRLHCPDKSGPQARASAQLDRSVRKMNRTYLVLLLVSLFAVFGTSEAIAASTQKPLICGKANITATQAGFREGQRGDDFIITIETDSQKKVLRYSNENEFLNLRCQPDKNGKLMLLVNHTCGGTGCAESNFGIIDLQTLDVVLRPDNRWKGNHDKAETILGVRIRPFSCKDFSGPQTNGDHCYGTIEY
jgi:hypothetical protein